MSTPSIYIVNPGVGVSGIRFGSTRDQVRQSLGVPTRSFKRTAESSSPCDEYSGGGLFVYYTKDDIVEAVEFFEPARVQLKNLDLLGTPFGRLVKALSAADPSLSVETDGLTSNALGIALYAPSAADDISARPESALVFAKGYFD